MRVGALALVGLLLVSAAFLLTDNIAVTAAAALVIGLAILPIAAKMGLGDVAAREMADLAGDDAEIWPESAPIKSGDRAATADDALVLSAAEMGEEELKRLAAELRPAAAAPKRATA